MTAEADITDFVYTVNASSDILLTLVQLVGGPEAWGTELGAQVFAKINNQLVGLNEGTFVKIDYAGLERSDVSFQREAVVETLRKHRPRVVFLAVNLDHPDLRLNLHLALEKRGESVLVESNNSVSVVGRRLTPEQQQILDAVRAGGELTSARLTEPPFSLKPSNASNQLTALWRAGLLRRIEGAAATGGREYRYSPIA